ncbi:MAG: tRNA (adenosine(37)-N6)-threonylcarbamoyltransferase complex ATPase subunit type 1 TsaE [Phycisphaerae bacterium]
MSHETFTTHSPEETIELGKRLAARLGVGDVVTLDGLLGAGKTVLTRGIALGLGLADERLVSSPTYVLVHEYPARVPVYHLDLYRMDSPAEELDDLGFDEMLETGVAVIEWASRAGDHLPHPRWRVEIEHVDSDTRRFTLARVD